MSNEYPQRRSWLGRRLGAWLYDTLLIIALWFLVGALVLAVRGGALPPVNTSWYSAMLAAVPWLFFVYFWRRGGQTLGMRAWKLKLVAADGGAPGLPACLARLTVATLTLGIGTLWVLLAPAHRSWQGMASHTRLIYHNHRTGPAPRR